MLLKIVAFHGRSENTLAVHIEDIKHTPTYAYLTHFVPVSVPLIFFAQFEFVRIRFVISDILKKITM
jgi:hypothetical protein